MTKSEIAKVKADKKSSFSRGMGYYLLDIDKNGIPELLVASKNTFVINPVYIYTYKGKKVTYIGKMKLTDNEVVDFGGVYYNVETKMLWICSSNNEDGYSISYKYNGKSIKRCKKYHYEGDSAAEKKLEKLRKLEGKAINFYSNTAKSRKKHLTF